MPKVIQFSFKNDPTPPYPLVDCRVIKNPYTPALTDAQCEAQVRREPNFDLVVQNGVRLLMTNDTIAVGCTYGRHRSGAVMREIALRTGAVPVYRERSGL